MVTALQWLTLFLCLSSFRLTAQPDPRFDLVALEEGVSNGFFTAICQDRKGRIWLGSALGLNCYDGYSFRSFLSKGDSLNSLINHSIWALACDEEDNLWIGTAGGLNKLDLSTETFSSFFHDPNDELSLSHNSIEGIAVDSVGQVWIGTANGLNLLRKESSTFIRYLYNAPPTNPKMVKSVFCDSRGVLWVGAADVLLRYQNDRFISFPLPAINGRRRSELQIRTIYEDSQNRLWIGTEGRGLFVFEKNAGQFALHYQHEANNENSLSHHRIAAIAEDETGAIWAATYGGGLNIINEATNTIRRVNIGATNSIKVKDLRSMWKDEAGNFWLGSSYEGLYLARRFHKRFHNYSKKNSGLSGKTAAFQEDEEGKIWIGTFEGLNYFDPKENRFIPLQKQPGLDKRLLHDKVNAITIDRAGILWMILNANKIVSYDPVNNTLTSMPPIYFEGGGDFIHILASGEDEIWIGSNNGIGKYEKTTQRVVYYALEKREGFGDNKRVTALYEDSKNNLWVSTYNGLNRYDRQKDAFTYYPCSYEIMAICESQNGVIWVGTRMGLANFDRSKERFQNLHHLQGMPRSRSVNAILEGRDQRLWFSTNNGLYNFDPASRKVSPYNRNDGLINNQFLNAALQTRSGEMYFSGISGFTRFKPEEIKKNSKPPSVLITSFQLFNQDVPIADSPADTLEWASPLSKAIAYTSKIELKYWQNDLAFEFAALDFTAPENNQYQYRLEGYDKIWKNTDAQRRYASYSNLDPGSYDFRVKASNNDGVWNEEGISLRIVITPPWWQTWAAYIAYALISFFLVRTIYIFQLKRKLAQAETERLRELDALKTRLFTNVAHEFRTPLTVILGMARQVKEDPKEWFSEGIAAITRNGRQLLRLVNQMLDLSRLDAGRMPIQYQQDDVVAFLGYLVQSFQSYAASKKVDLRFSKEVETLKMDYAPESLAKVVNNLLSNAIKFTPEKGEVLVNIKVEKKQLLLSIKDNGAGISEKHLPHIFDRFYQADNSTTRVGEGTGVGLALVKELIHLMRGEITTASRLGKGTHFMILLPIANAAPLSSDEYVNEEDFQDLYTPPAYLETTGGEEASTVLIIEDNPDVANYIGACLKDKYRIQMAANGRLGLEKTLETMPDMIVCDVMMPEMDGYELCYQLKNDERISHIPIVMLTAKADVQSRIEGFRLGADAYLAKPFHREELEVRLENLIALRKKLQEQFAGFPNENTKAAADFEREDAFLQKLRALVHDHLEEETFGISEICLELAVSRTQLHRKLKALTGRSASHVIRSIRLQRAKELLLSSNQNISEIAYQVGFKNPSYFSASFADEFQQSPTEMREKRDLEQ